MDDRGQPVDFFDGFGVMESVHGVGLCDESPSIYYPQDFEGEMREGVITGW